jgi:hypothetical protein
VFWSVSTDFIATPEPDCRFYSHEKGSESQAKKTKNSLQNDYSLKTGHLACGSKKQILLRTKPNAIGFNTSLFANNPAYTRRTNPWYYYNIRGPQFFNVDATLSKEFPLTEKYKFQLRVETYNALNNCNVNKPNMSLSSARFGMSTDIYSNAYGRRFQFGLRLRF